MLTRLLWTENQMPEFILPGIGGDGATKPGTGNATTNASYIVSNCNFSMVGDNNRTTCRPERMLLGLADPDHDTFILFGMPYGLEDRRYGESRREMFADRYIKTLQPRRGSATITCNQLSRSFSAIHAYVANS